MARLYCLLVLLMAVAEHGYLTEAVDLPDVTDPNVVATKSQGVGANGRAFNFTQITAKDCSQRYTLIQYADGEVQEFMDDLLNNLGVARLSTTPNKCFVRDITGTKAKCQNGVFPSTAANPGSELTNYVSGGNVSAADLPQSVRDMCTGQTFERLVLASLVPGGGRTVRDTDIHARNRRQTICTKTTTNCRKCTCVGWLFRKRTCQTCCDEVETCITPPG